MIQETTKNTQIQECINVHVIQTPRVSVCVCVLRSPFQTDQHLFLFLLFSYFFLLFFLPTVFTAVVAVLSNVNFWDFLLFKIKVNEDQKWTHTKWTQQLHQTKNKRKEKLEFVFTVCTNENAPQYLHQENTTQQAAPPPDLIPQSPQRTDTNQCPVHVFTMSVNKKSSPSILTQNPSLFTHICSFDSHWRSADLLPLSNQWLNLSVSPKRRQLKLSTNHLI